MTAPQLRAMIVEDEPEIADLIFERDVTAGQAFIPELLDQHG